MPDAVTWKQALEGLEASDDRRRQEEILALLDGRVQTGKIAEQDFVQDLNQLYRKVKDPWLSGEIKRLENRFRGRRILGRDLLRLKRPPTGDNLCERLWHDVHALKSTHDGAKGESERFEEKYDLCEQIGDGGMSVVFRAVRLADGAEVAIKYLRKEYIDSASIVARFQRECRLCLSFDHPNIVKVHEVSEYAGGAFMVMEYLPLGGVDRLLGDPGLTPCRAVTVMCQTAQALAYIHAKGVVHRDVKLSNILISKWPEESGADKENILVKLSDFGLSKELAGEGLTKTGTRMGTDFYAAPEQRESPRDVDQRADIYSMGVAIYRLISGTGYPEGDYPALHELNPDIPEDFDGLVATCLKVDRAKRYRSARALAGELAGFEKRLCGAVSHAV